METSEKAKLIYLKGFNDAVKQVIEKLEKWVEEIESKIEGKGKSNDEERA